jgi:hypothetical protein
MGLLMALDVVVPTVTSMVAVLIALMAIVTAFTSVVRLQWLLLIWPMKQW